MTIGNDFAFNDTATRLASTGAHGVSAYNPPLTKREYFAAMAMQAIISGLFTGPGINHGWPDKEIANKSTDYADALIEALNR